MSEWLNHKDLDIAKLEKIEHGTGVTYFYFNDEYLERHKTALYEDKDNYIFGNFRNTGYWVFDQNFIEYWENSEWITLEKLDNPNPSRKMKKYQRKEKVKRLIK